MRDATERRGLVLESNLQGALDDLKDANEVEASKKIKQANRSDPKGAEVLDEIDENAGDRDG